VRARAAGTGWVGAIVAVVAAFVVAGLVAQALLPAPQGPALSSYATAPGGVAAWAELLAREGHRVSQLREPITSAALAPDDTLVVLEAGGPQDDTSEAPRLAAPFSRRLERFVLSGGWLIVSGVSQTVSQTVGRGRIETLGDPSFLENRLLGDGGNALRALELVGPAGRNVVFDEAIHGFGPATGLAALPARWWLAIALLGAAGGASILSRWLRLGGADPLAAAAPSPRVAFVTTMAATLARTRDRSELAELARRARERERAFERSV